MENLKEQIEDILDQFIRQQIYNLNATVLKEEASDKILKLIEDNYVRKDDHSGLVEALQKILTESAIEDFKRACRMIKQVKDYRNDNPPGSMGWDGKQLP